jgi:hypothetical protein
VAVAGTARAAGCDGAVGRNGGGRIRGGWWTGRADLGCTGSIDDEEASGDDEMESLLVGWI